MGILRWLFRGMLVIGSALAGNWLGGQLRSTITGQRVQSLSFQYKTPQGRTIRNTPVVTKFYPALLLGSVGRPRWLFAFLGGLATGVLLSDRYERLLWQQVEKMWLHTPARMPPAQCLRRPELGSSYMEHDLH